MPALCDSAYIFIQVDTINHAPVAGDTTYHILNNKVFSGNLKTLVTDPDNNINPTSFVVTVSPLSGTLNLQADGSFTYTPLNTFTGITNFIYRICDLGSPVLCDTGIVYFIIDKENKAPFAVDDSFTIEENTEITFEARKNDMDSDGILENPVIIVQPSNGSVTLNSAGLITYKPAADFIGNDVFSYRVCDNGTPTLCDSAKVKITVTRSADHTVRVPEGFSPNGDGINDLFVIKNIDRCPNNKLTIVNRWGMVVYEKQSYNNDWGGQSNQGAVMEGTLPAGTYFYLLDPGNNEDIFKGYVYITR